MKISRAEHDALLQELVDQGRLVESGFQGLRFATMHPDAPELQISEMRMAFFAGAQHLFASVLAMMGEGSEVTAVELHRMTMISEELDTFVAEFKARFSVAD